MFWRYNIKEENFKKNFMKSPKYRDYRKNKLYIVDE